MRNLGFLRQFVARPTSTGAIAPSSAPLADLITDAADLGHASMIVEFGPGTGVFTEKILLKRPAHAGFIAIELNEQFVAATRRRCPTATVHHDSAVNVGTHLNALGVDGCDRIVCGLPWASFPERLQDDLLEATLGALRPGGRIVTFAYLQGLLMPPGLRFRRKLRQHFRRVTTTRTVWRNLPPAFVYIAEK